MRAIELEAAMAGGGMEDHSIGVYLAGLGLAPRRRDLSVTAFAIKPKQFLPVLDQLSDMVVKAQRVGGAAIGGRNRRRRAHAALRKNGRASCRERVCQYG